MDGTPAPAGPARNMRRFAAAALAAAALAAIAALGLLPLLPERLPILCPLYGATGLYCATCGATRATAALLHGHLAEAFDLNPLFVVSLPGLAYLALAGWLRLLPGGPALPLPRFGRTAAAVSLAALIAYTVLRNLPWPALAWLAP